MSEFLQALVNPTVPFVRYAFIAGLLASIAFGMVGSYVVARRISYIAGAIAHCCLGGIGLALYLQSEHGITWLHPVYGAVIAALLAAVIIGEVSRRGSQREDTVIGALWSIGMSVGVIFLSMTHNTNGVDAMSYLFGNIMLTAQRDIMLIVVLDLVVIVLAGLFYNQFLAVCFDEEFAKLRGVPVHAYYQLMLCLTALTVVLLLSIVGIVMVIALLTLPAAIAGLFCNRLWQMMALSVVLCAVFTGVGLAVSYPTNLPAGPTIILVAGAVYLLVIIGLRLRRALRRPRFPVPVDPGTANPPA